MKKTVKNIEIEMVENTIKMNGVVVSFRATNKLFNEIVSDVIQSGKWFTYALSLKK